MVEGRLIVAKTTSDDRTNYENSMNKSGDNSNDSNNINYKKNSNKYRH